MSEATVIRPMTPADKPLILAAIKDTGMFSDAEHDVALELIDIFLHKKDQKDYIIHVAEYAGAPVGYVCFGPTPATEGTYDLYWIAVSPKLHNKGIGRKLLAFTETEVAKRGGRMLIIETSSQERYAPTQGFYLRNGYTIEARIKDFYKAGDDRLIFTKKLNSIDNIPAKV
jgi:ribosomal protein S18 acetylase RimI-like enzyme